MATTTDTTDQAMKAFLQGLAAMPDGSLVPDAPFLGDWEKKEYAAFNVMPKDDEAGFVTIRLYPEPVDTPQGRSQRYWRKGICW